MNLLSDRILLRKTVKTPLITIEGIFSDVTSFYIDEHLNTFSKYFIIFQYAYK